MPDAEGLRLRITAQPAQTRPSQVEEEVDEKQKTASKTIGRTPDGTRKWRPVLDLGGPQSKHY